MRPLKPLSRFRSRYAFCRLAWVAMSLLLFKWPVTRYSHDADVTRYGNPPKMCRPGRSFLFSFRFLSPSSFAPDCQPRCVCQSWWWGVTLSDRLPCPFKRQVTFFELEKSDRTGVGRRALWPMRANASSFRERSAGAEEGHGVGEEREISMRGRAERRRMDSVSQSCAKGVHG